MIVERAAETLAEQGIETPRVDAEWIVAHAVGVSRSELVAVSHEVDVARVWPLVERRAGREPLAYVLGEWDFRRLTLACDSRALIPRPETEGLVERCVELLRARARTADGRAPTVLDVGTGSGAIALALADETGARVVALDSSVDALALARENAARTGIAVTLVHGDAGRGLPPGPFDLVVSNPPYVLPEEWEELPPEVRDWEPRDALVDTGQTEAIARAARGILRDGASIVLEVHERRANEIAVLLAESGYVDIRITRDLAGRDRVVEGTKT